jgi:hypothetical protein
VVQVVRARVGLGGERGFVGDGGPDDSVVGPELTLGSEMITPGRSLVVARAIPWGLGLLSMFSWYSNCTVS